MTKPDQDLELYAIRYGTSLLPAKVIFGDASSEEFLPVAWCFYAARRDDRVTLFDVGFRDVETATTRGVELLDVSAEVAEVFRPREVDTVVLTHAHFDHIENVDLYPDARLILSSGTRAEATESASDGVRARLAGMGVEVVDASLNIGEFTLEVVGGHLRGSSVVHFPHAGRHYVLTGDECYYVDNLRSRRPIGVLADRARNLEFLDRARVRSWVPLPCHDPGIFDTFPLRSPNVARIG